jgi:hypothetical protein
MRRTLFLTLVAIAIAVVGIGAASTSRDGETVRILFIGNSLTSANNLPAMVAAIAKSHGNKLIYDAHTPGGATLSRHASSNDVLEKLRQQSWDFVVLQEQSQLPGFATRLLAKGVFPHAMRLVEETRMANSHTSVVFYMAMAHRNGDPANKRMSPDLLTFEGAQRRINKTYLQMAQKNHTLVAPVGVAWRTVRKKYPEIALYADDVHPNPTGTYLAACVFYATLFQSPCSGAAVPRGVDKSTATSLQQTADAVVLNPGSSWDWRE